jgi:hypothetical protein
VIDILIHEITHEVARDWPKTQIGRVASASETREVRIRRTIAQCA